MSDVQTWIKETVTATPVVLFMKGTAQFPQCDPNPESLRRRQHRHRERAG
jgi:glutaredoxin-related protein